MRAIRAAGRDLVSGMVFLLIGALGLYVGQAYRVGTALDMGPGYIPRALSWLLIGFGILICAKGLLAGGERMPRIHLRPVVLVSASLLLFAFLLGRAGLVISTVASVIVASFAGQDSRLPETIALAIGLALAAAAVFVVALGLPIRLWPW